MTPLSTSISAEQSSATHASGAVCIVWTTSVAAIRSVESLRAWAATLSPGAEVRIEWRIPSDPRGPQAECVAAASGSRHTLARGTITTTIDEETRLTHVTVRDSARELLVAVLRRDPRGVATILYARSSVLEGLALGGGRYSIANEAPNS